MKKILSILRIAAGLVACTTALSAQAETYPTRPVTLVVPYAHGGITDLYARVIGDYLGRHWQTQVIVDNRGGGATTIGTQLVARAQPDGYTILLTSYAYTANPVLRDDLNYEPSSFEPVMLLGTSRSMLVVDSNSELKTMDDVIAKGKESPGNLTFASSGNASSPHIAAELWAKEVGVTITHVPYKGTSPAMNDLYGGLVDGIFDGPSSISSVEAGRLRALGIAHDTRHPAAPDVPTFKEQGIDMVFGSWFGFLVPKGTPTPVVDKINAGLNDAIKDPQVQAALDRAGLFVTGGTPAEFGEFLDYESKRLQGLVDAGVELIAQ